MIDDIIDHLMAPNHILSVLAACFLAIMVIHTVYVLCGDLKQYMDNRKGVYKDISVTDLLKSKGITEIYGVLDIECTNDIDIPITLYLVTEFLDQTSAALLSDPND